MRLEPLAENLWSLDGRHVKLMPGAYLPLRATVVRLSDGGLWVHSPVKMEADDWAEIDALGPVRHLVAPNNLHHLYLGPWKARYPEARLVGARGLRKKRPDLSFDATLDEDVRWPGLEQVFIEGAPAWGETVFFHAETRTLICTDLFFNVRPSNSRGFLTPLLLRLVGAWSRPMQSRLIRSVTKDPARAGASVARVLEWPFERAVMAHGAVVDEDARAVVRSACHWMLGAAGVPATADAA